MRVRDFSGDCSRLSIAELHGHGVISIRSPILRNNSNARSLLAAPSAAALVALEAILAWPAKAAFEAIDLDAVAFGALPSRHSVTFDDFLG